MRIVEDDHMRTEWQITVLRRHLLAWSIHHADDTLFDPCVGSDGMVPVAWPDADWTTNDVDPGVIADYHLDARFLSSHFLRGHNHNRGTMPRDRKFDWAISYPPCKDAVPFVDAALQVANRVAMFLRLTHLEPCRNRKHQEPPDAIITVPRRGYPKDGKFGFASGAWMIWGNPGYPVPKGIFKIRRDTRLP